MAEVAKEYRVSLQVIQILINKAHKKEDFLGELWTLKEVKNMRKQVIMEVVQGMVDRDEFINNLASVVEAV